MHTLFMLLSNSEWINALDTINQKLNFDNTSEYDN